MRKVCGSGRNYDSLSLSLNKEMLKNCYSFTFTPSLSLYICMYVRARARVYIYIHTYTHVPTHAHTQDLAVWSEADCFGGNSGSFTMLLYSAQRSAAGRTYTQTNTQELVLHPTPSSTRFKSRRGNLNTEFHVFLRNVCPIHFGMCIHKLLLLFTVTKP